MIKLSGVLLAAALSLTALSSPVPVKGRTGLIKGPIGRGALVLSQGLTQFGVTSLEPVSLIIDSPGGSIIAGNLIINAVDNLKSKGIQVNCYVTGMAASMAFQILLHCSNRYALPYSMFLWHSARIMNGGVLTSTAALELAQALDYVDRGLVGDMINTMKGDTQEILRHYRSETMHLADQVNALSPNFLKVESTLHNSFDLLEDKEVLTSETKNTFFFFFRFDIAKLVYITNKRI